jgi:hypothetical protein
VCSEEIPAHNTQNMARRPQMAREIIQSVARRFSGVINTPVWVVISFTTVKMWILVFWVVTPCGAVVANYYGPSLSFTLSHISLTVL